MEKNTVNIARKLGISSTTIKDWVRDFELKNICSNREYDDSAIEAIIETIKNLKEDNRGLVTIKRAINTRLQQDINNQLKVYKEKLKNEKYEPTITSSNLDYTAFSTSPRPYGNNVWIEINIEAFVKNIFTIKQFISPKTKIMGVVKADAYGHGSEYLTPIAISTGVIDQLGVATVAEGEKLRNNGIKIPILVLGALLPHQIPAALKNDLQIIANSIDILRVANATAESEGKIINVHLKIDTGMGRIGVSPEQVISIIEDLKFLRGVKLQGICTHFAMSESIGISNYTKQQFELFCYIINRIKEKIELPALHVANTDAIFLHPDTHLDIVRPGIGMYGLCSNEKINLQPILTLNGCITQIREFPAGSKLGYGCKFITKNNSQIAIVPIGYADGLPRILSNNQDVLVQGKRCPIVGMISMDQCLIDITGLKVKLGEKVTFLGRQGKEEITAKEWAKNANTIPYEILCGLGNRLTRYYI